MWYAINKRGLAACVVAMLLGLVWLAVPAFAAQGVYGYSVTAADGKEIPLSDYEGKVLLIINTATECGFTPQYAPLEEMYEKYRDRGFEIIDIPCNQFGGQAPGTDEEIHNFCALNYATQFPQMRKSDVNGENELPLYTYLKSQKGFAGFGEGKMAGLMDAMMKKRDPNYANTSDIKWNFTKFVVNREGEVVARFEPTADMAGVERCVVLLL